VYTIQHGGVNSKVSQCVLDGLRFPFDTPQLERPMVAETRRRHLRTNRLGQIERHQSRRLLARRIVPHPQPPIIRIGELLAWNLALNRPKSRRSPHDRSVNSDN